MIPRILHSSVHAEITRKVMVNHVYQYSGVTVEKLHNVFMNSPAPGMCGEFILDYALYLVTVHLGSV
jgi:hypothetical protein